MQDDGQTPPPPDEEPVLEPVKTVETPKMDEPDNTEAHEALAAHERALKAQEQKK